MLFERKCTNKSQQTASQNPHQASNILRPIKQSFILAEISANIPQKMKIMSDNSQKREKKLPSKKEIAAEDINQQEVRIKPLTLQQNNSLSEEDFQKVAKIGYGAFGSVYFCKKKSSDSVLSVHTYAMKIIPKRQLQQTKTTSNLILQKKILTQFQSNFITKLKYSFQNKSNCFMVMEYARGGSFYSYLYNQKQPKKVQMFRKLGQNGIRFVLGCIILALQKLHSKNIVYRDLKPQNVLIFQDGYVKLTDFGLAKQCQQGQFLSQHAGTRIYLAPEVIEDQKYNKLVDLWAMGVLLYEMIFLEPPFQAMYIAPRRFRKICLKNQIERKWKSGNISEEAKSLINAFLKVNPLQRLGAQNFKEIKDHKFFEGFHWNDLESHQMQSPLLNIVKQIGQSEQIKRAIQTENIIEDNEQHESITDFQYGEKWEEMQENSKVSKNFNYQNQKFNQ